MTKPELLSPAGDWVSLRAAIGAGADAVYFGVKELNMRANAKNFELGELKKTVKTCHENNVRAYLALNTIVYENELKKTEKILKRAKEAGIDAIICWDLSVLKLCRMLKLRIHLSTQASVSNYPAAEYYCRKFGVKRIVLARESTLDDIKKIIKRIRKNKLGLQIETFVHGAMCVSISGRCFLSQFAFNKSANRGQCLQPCRRKYLIRDIEEKHEFELGEYYVMSPEDLCTIEFIEQLKRAGINAFKIEGRNRPPEYVKAVTECYRRAIDEGYDRSLLLRLKAVYNRGFSSGFFLGKPADAWSRAYGSKAAKKKEYIGKVVNYYRKQKAAEIKIETGRLALGDTIMFQGNTTGVVEQKITSMQNERRSIGKAEKGMCAAVRASRVRKNDRVYLIIS
ncbi:U32 family peptidase [Candidatus Woesearchaeota archaeon]|nr:U32 family peptidase [Candidatus Woesearchaeota archaeon]